MTARETGRDTTEQQIPLRRQGLIAGVALAARLLAARPELAATSGTGPGRDFVIGSKGDGASQVARCTDRVPTSAAFPNDTSLNVTAGIVATTTEVGGVRGFAGGTGNGGIGLAATDARKQGHKSVKNCTITRAVRQLARKMRRRQRSRQGRVSLNDAGRKQVARCAGCCGAGQYWRG